jgi:LysM repeat protein
LPTAAAERRRRDVGTSLPILHRLSVRLSPVRGTAAVLLVAASAALAPAGAQSLRGSPESVDRMYQQAQREHLQFSETAGDVHAAAGRGALVPLTASNDVTLRRVAFPYVTPATKAFVAQLGRQHRAECGAPLMVTSAARPTTRQPANSVAQSVHPTGMAIDLRKPKGRCLRWLRETLLELEDAGVIEATEERRPPHFHVAVFPTSYTRYAAATRVTTTRTATAGATVAAAKASSEARSRRTARASTRLAAAPRSERRYRVRPGDTLWDIARANETSVRQILSANRMRKPVIRPGQQLVLPTRVAAAVAERESVGQ